MNENKPYWQSKTVWAGVAGVLASVLVFFNVESTPTEIGAVANGLASLAAIIGRIVAKKQLALK